MQGSFIKQLFLYFKVLYNSSSRVYQKMTIEELQRSWNTAVLDRSDYAVTKEIYSDLIMENLFIYCLH